MNRRTEALAIVFGALVLIAVLLVWVSGGLNEFIRHPLVGESPPAVIRSSTPAAVNAGGDGPLTGLPSYAPNGSEVAFVTDWRDALGIWAISTVAGSVRLIVSDLNAAMIDPAWSPSGAWIAFASNKTGNFNIWQIRPDGTGLTQVTTGSGMNHQPAWSPDNMKIAFVSNRTGSRAIWVVNGDGSGLRRVTNLSGQESHPSFSPDGTQLVFAESDGSQSNLWIINADGAGLRQLTTGAFRDRDPVWSTRGIAFASDRSGPYAIWMVQPNGTGLQAVPNARGTNPSWSSDGTRVAFSFGPVNEFNFSNSTIRELVRINGISVDIDPQVGPFEGPGVGNHIPVRILSSSTFDPVNNIDRTSITFGVTGDENSILLNPDGTRACWADYRAGVTVPDLMCDFSSYRAGGVGYSTPVILRARDVNQTRFEGRGSTPPPPVW